LLIEGKKRHLINAKRLKLLLLIIAKNTTIYIKRLREYYPFEIKRIQTNNGSEIEDCARDYLKANNLTHSCNYARNPKSNAFIERFNAPIKERLQK
jgi:transposase InsO family protein